MYVFAMSLKLWKGEGGGGNCTDFSGYFLKHVPFVFISYWAFYPFLLVN